MAEDTRKPSAPTSTSWWPSIFSSSSTATASPTSTTASNPEPLSRSSEPPSTSPSSTPSTTDPPRRSRPRPKHDFPQTQAGKLWDALGNPSDPANTLPGGTYNSAGGRPREVTWRDAFTFDWLFGRDGAGGASKVKFWQTGCARDSTLVGMGVGGAVGGLGFVVRGLSSMLLTTNYAVGAFAITSVGMYTWCTSRQREEMKGMAIAVAGMKMLNEKKLKEKAEEEQRQKVKEREEEERRRKQGWKLW